MTELSKWADNASGNATGATPDYPPENMDKSDVNDVMRELMAGIRVWYQDPTFINIFESNDETWAFSKQSDTVIRVNGPVDPSTILNEGRRIRIEPGPVLGYVVSVAAAAPNFDITVLLDAAGVVPTTPTQVEIGCVGGGNGMFLNTGTSGTKLMIAEDLQATMTAVLAADSAANKEFGTDTDQLPQNSDLGSASLATVGTAPTEVPTQADVDTAILAQTLAKGKRNFHEIGSDYATPSTNLETVIGLSGIIIPGGPDGSKLYRITVSLYLEINSLTALDEISLRMGSNGDKTDAVLAYLAEGKSFDSGSQASYGIASDTQSYNFKVTLFTRPSATDELSIGVDFDNSPQDWVFAAYAGKNPDSYVYVELVDDLWED